MMPTVYLYLGLALVILAGLWFVQTQGDGEFIVRLREDWQDQDHVSTLQDAMPPRDRLKAKPSGAKRDFSRNR